MTSRYPDGTSRERPSETHEFIFGVERQVPALEKVLDGKGPGETFRVLIPPTEIFGERDPELIREIPKEGLIRQRLKEGEYYRQMKMGCLVSFKVLEVRPKTVLADFNKPMAGISVSLDVTILDIRKASPSEIEAACEAEVKRSIGCG
jgi:FKBP-type peptidyl-prolyl cis-trans isomerase SlyD